MNKIVNQDNTIDNILSYIVNHNTKQHWPTFHLLVWRLRAGTRVRLKLLLLVDKIEWFMILIFVKMLLVTNLQKWNHFFLPCDKPDLCNNCILKDTEYIDCFCITFLCHYVFNQGDSDTDLVDNVILMKNILQPTEKPKSVGPNKSKLEKTTSKKKSPLRKEMHECEHTITWIT